MKAVMKASMVAALLCGAMQPPLVAQSSTSAEQATPSAQALELASLYLPATFVRSRAEDGYRKNFQGSFDKNPEGAKAEERFPGFYQVTLDAGIATMKVGYDHHLPIAIANLALVFEREFTSAQRQQLIIFYQSSAGRKTVELGSVTSDTKVLPDHLDRDAKSFAISREYNGGMMNPNFIASLSKEEIKEMITFSSSPAGRRFLEASPVLEGVIVAETNSMNRSIMAAQQEAISNAVAEHIASFRKEKGQNK